MRSRPSSAGSSAGSRASASVYAAAASANWDFPSNTSAREYGSALCARARGASAHASVSAMATKRATSPARPARARRAVLRLRIDPLEVLHHRLTLFRREPAQLAPRGLGIFEQCAPRRVGVRGLFDLRIDRRLRLALPRVLALVLLQREPCVEEAVKEFLLAVEQRCVDAPRLELRRDVAHLLRHLRRARLAGARLVHALREPALRARERAPLCAPLAAGLRAGTGHQRRRLSVQRSLLLRELPHLLDHLGEARRGLSVRCALTIGHE